MDDIRPPRRGPEYQGQTNPQPNQIYNQSYSQPNQDYSQETPSSNLDHSQQYHLPEAKKKSSKGKVFSRILVVLLILALAGLSAYLYFVKMAEMQTEIDDLKQENARLVQQVRSLDYDNRDLKQKLELEQQKNIEQEMQQQE